MPAGRFVVRYSDESNEDRIFCLRFFVFVCFAAQEKDDWIGAIGRAIVQASSTYQGDNNNGDSDSEDDYNYR